jgi:hypothetical protein
MIRTRNAVLLSPSKTELASSTDPTREPDPDQPTHFQSSAMLDIGTESNHSADSFVATDVGQFDLRDGVTIWSSRGAGFGMQIY